MMTKELGMQSGPSKTMSCGVLVFQRRVQGNQEWIIETWSSRGCPHGTIYSSSPHLPREEAIEYPVRTLLHMSVHAYFGITCSFLLSFSKYIIHKYENLQFLYIVFKIWPNVYGYVLLQSRYKTVLSCRQNLWFFLIHSFSYLWPLETSQMPCVQTLPLQEYP